MGAAMMKKEEKFITGGNQILMCDVRPHGLTGSKVEMVFYNIHITSNKNSVVGDKNAVNPGGVRLGTLAFTTRGMKEAEMEIVAEFLLKGLEIA
jgi:glycine hydroxymethyltransferase